jgi:hypothetical protein
MLRTIGVRKDSMRLSIELLGSVRIGPQLQRGDEIPDIDVNNGHVLAPSHEFPGVPTRRVRSYAPRLGHHNQQVFGYIAGQFLLAHLKDPGQYRCFGIGSRDM